MYNHIETTVKLSSESHEKYMGVSLFNLVLGASLSYFTNSSCALTRIMEPMQHSFEFGAGPQIESDSDIAIGLGMAPGPEIASGVLKGEATPVIGHIEHSVHSLQEVSFQVKGPS